MDSLEITNISLTSHRIDTRDYYPNDQPDVDSLIMQGSLTLHRVTSNQIPKNNKWDYKFELSVGRRLLDELDAAKEALDPTIKPAFVMVNAYDIQLTSTQEIDFETEQCEVLNFLAAHVKDDSNQIFRDALRTLNMTC